MEQAKENAHYVGIFMMNSPRVAYCAVTHTTA